MKEAISRKKMHIKQCVRIVLIVHCQNVILRLVKGLKINSKEVEGGRCMRGIDGRLCFSGKEKGKVWKDYMERMMYEENDWDRNVEEDAVESVIVCVSMEKVLQALNENRESPRTFRSIIGVNCC